MKKKPLSFQELTSVIETFEDICKRQGDKPEDILPHKNPKTLRQHVNNDNARLDYIAEYLQQGSKDRYYYPVFYDRPSGFGFSDSDYGGWSASATCGSRLWQPTREKSDFFGRQFVEIHERLLTNKYKIK